VQVSITKSKHVPVRWNGEETKGLQNAGTFSSIQPHGACGGCVGYRMGKTLVVVHHGDKAKPEKFRDVVCSDFAADWGETEFRYLDGGHVHHSQRKELAGCVFESWNNLAPRDKYAHDGGWRSKQCMSLVVRSRSYGEVARHVMPIERVRDIIREKHPEHYVPPAMRAFSA